MKICKFPSCYNPHDSLGYCKSHARQLRQGRSLSKLVVHKFVKGHGPYKKSKAGIQRIRKAVSNANFKGGRYVDNNGYVRIHIYLPSDSYRGQAFYEHILIMEAHIGRPLEKGEIVHHINEEKTDNRIENLQIMTIREHLLHHRNIKWLLK